MLKPPRAPTGGASRAPCHRPRRPACDPRTRDLGVRRLVEKRIRYGLTERKRYETIVTCRSKEVVLEGRWFGMYVSGSDARRPRFAWYFLLLVAVQVCSVLHPEPAAASRLPCTIRGT